MKTPSPSLHPGFIDKLIPRGPDGEQVADPALTAARDAMARARAAAEKMHAIANAISNDPSAPAPVRALKARDAIGPLAVQSAKQLDAVRGAIAAELERLKAETSSPPSTAPALEAEIRGRLSVMDSTARGELIAKAIDRGDDVVIGAILRGPAWLSGISDAERELRRGAWRRRAHPKHVEREQRIEQALAVIDRSGKILIGYASELIDQKEAAKAEEAQQATARAMAS